MTLLYPQWFTCKVVSIYTVNWFTILLYQVLYATNAVSRYLNLYSLNKCTKGEQRPFN